MSHIGEEENNHGSDELSDSRPQSPSKPPSRKKRKTGKSPVSPRKSVALGKAEPTSSLTSSPTVFKTPRLPTVLKSPRSTSTKDSGIAEGTDEDSTPFRRFSHMLDSESESVRQTPPQMLPTDLGSPTKVWSLLCRKDELFRRNRKSLENQLKGNHRSLVLDWIMEVCCDRKLHRETFHLCVDYFDRYLAKVTTRVPPEHIQLVASAALVVAAKMEEIYPPKIEEIAEYTDSACTAEQICIMEEIMLETLDWRCSPVTAVHWLALYMQLMSTHDQIVSAQAQFPKLQHQQQQKPRTPAGVRKITDWCRTPVSTSAKSLKSLSVVDQSLRRSTDSIGSEHFYEGNDSYSHGHIYPERQFVVPKLMRDEFVRLAKILDLCLLHIDSLNFSYSELAAAVVFCCYEPEFLVHQITGFRADQLVDVVTFVEPFMKLCEQLEPAGTPIPFFDDIAQDDWHNIQTRINDSGDLLSEVEKLRAVSEQRRKAVDKSTFRASKRKHTATS